MSWWASVSPKDDGNDGISRRQDGYVCWRGEFGEVKVVRPGRRPKFSNPGGERDQVPNLDGSDDGRRGREDHDTS